MNQINNQQLIENLVLTCIDTAKAMLREYQLIVPFGIRAYTDSGDMKMNCPADQYPEADWQEQIKRVAEELKSYSKTENIYATALVTELQSGDENGIGIQIEADMSPVLFIYPYRIENDDWIVDAPIQADQLLIDIISDE